MGLVGQKASQEIASPGVKWWHYLLICVGYGCFLAYFPIGSVGTFCLTQFAPNWQSVLVARLFFVIATIAVIMICRTKRIDSVFDHANVRRVSAVATALSFVVLYSLGRLLGNVWDICCFSLLLGASTAIPKLSWYETFLDVYRAKGRGPCIITVAGCFLVAAAFMPILEIMTLNETLSLGGALLLVALSACCLEGVAYMGTPPPRDELKTEFHATPHTRSVLICFGVTWMFTFTVAANSGFGSGGFSHSSSWGVMLSGLVTCSILIIAFSKWEAIGKMRFGTLIRWVIVTVGSTWTFMPLISGSSAPLACFLCSMLYIVQSTIMILFICEVCEDYGMTITAVTSTHYGNFILSACGGGVAYLLLFTFADEGTAFQIMAGIAVVACLAIVPFLPRRGSHAGEFALDELPEDSNTGGNQKRTVEDIAESHQLTARETEVLRYLVDGYSRNEIAELLSISAWTVKHHIASVYEKTSVHSARELIVLMSGAPTDGISKLGQARELV